MTKPAQPLPIKEYSYIRTWPNPTGASFELVLMSNLLFLVMIADKKVAPRTSNSQLTNLSRPNSANPAITTTTTSSGTTDDNDRKISKQLLRATISTRTFQEIKDKRTSTPCSDGAPENKEAAVLRTMHSLEGTRKHYTAWQKEKAQEAFGAIKRPAPEPPVTVEKEREKEVARPTSLDSAQALATKKKKNGDERRSLGLGRIGGSSLSNEKEKIDKEKIIEKPMAPPTSPRGYTSIYSFIRTYKLTSSDILDQKHEQNVPATRAYLLRPHKRQGVKVSAHTPRLMLPLAKYSPLRMMSRPWRS